MKSSGGSEKRLSVRKAPSPKLQAPSSKLQAPSLESSELQASSPKHKGSSFKPQASSSKILEPGYMYIFLSTSLEEHGPRASAVWFQNYTDRSIARRCAFVNFNTSNLF
jgi:hypothetical protein